MSKVTKAGSGRPATRRHRTPCKHLEINSRYRQITIDGRTLSLEQWCEERGISISTVQRRLRNGMSLADALTLKAWGRVSASKTEQLIDDEINAESAHRVDDKYAGQMVAKNIFKWRMTGKKTYLINAGNWIKSMVGG